MNKSVSYYSSKLFSLTAIALLILTILVFSGCTTDNSNPKASSLDGKYLVTDHSFSYNSGSREEELNGEDIDYSKVYLIIDGEKVTFNYYGKNHTGIFDLDKREVKDLYGDQNNAYYEGLITWDENVDYLVGGVTDCEWTSLIQDEENPNKIKLDFSFDYNGVSVYDNYVLTKE